MAKHTQGKSMSKGQRTSCKGNVKASQAIMPSIPTRTETAMRVAFRNSITTGAMIIKESTPKKVYNSLMQGAGTKPTGRGWTADVSHRTFKALQASGVFA